MVIEELFRLKDLWSDGEGEQLKYKQRNLSTGSSSTVRDTWTGFGSTQDRRSERPEANRLSHCAAFMNYHHHHHHHHHHLNVGEGLGVLPVP
jgi:hypothetical protein